MYVFHAFVTFACVFTGERDKRRCFRFALWLFKLLLSWPASGVICRHAKKKKETVRLWRNSICCLTTHLSWVSWPINRSWNHFWPYPIRLINVVSPPTRSQGQRRTFDVIFLFCFFLKCELQERELDLQLLDKKKSMENKQALKEAEPRQATMFMVWTLLNSVLFLCRAAQTLQYCNAARKRSKATCPLSVLCSCIVFRAPFIQQQTRVNEARFAGDHGHTVLRSRSRRWRIFYLLLGLL